MTAAHRRGSRQIVGGVCQARVVSWMQRLYHAVTCTDTTCDPSCEIADPAQPAGRFCPRVADEIGVAESTLAP